MSLAVTSSGGNLNAIAQRGPGRSTELALERDSSSLTTTPSIS